MIKLTPLGSKVWVEITGQDGYSVDKSDIDFVQLDETHISIDLLGGGPILLSDLEMNGVVPANLAALKAAIATVFPNAGGSATSTYLIYTALLSQSGTDAPVATVLENTIGGIVWQREDVGEYSANLTGAFTDNKTVMPPFTNNYIGNSLPYIPVSNQSAITGYYAFEIINSSVIYIDFRNPSWALAEWSAIMDATKIFMEIRVYP